MLKRQQLKDNKNNTIKSKSSKCQMLNMCKKEEKEDFDEYEAENKGRI